MSEVSTTQHFDINDIPYDQNDLTNVHPRLDRPEKNSFLFWDYFDK